MGGPRGLGATRASRRIVFHGLGALGVAAALAGCGDGEDGDAPEADTGTALASTADVPVGGGIILTDEKVVITQPTEGEFKAFSAVCTHQKLNVTSVQDGVILCGIHDSSYSAATGAVEDGPAPEPLAEVAITVDGDRILSV